MNIVQILNYRRKFFLFTVNNLSKSEDKKSKINDNTNLKPNRYSNRTDILIEHYYNIKYKIKFKDGLMKYFQMIN